MNPRVLVLGYGNPGRRDDGLGPALARAIAASAPDGVSVESGYQLVIEDALLVADHDVVVFVDAHRACPDPFVLQPVEECAGAAFTTHAVAPGELLALVREALGTSARGYALGIRGEDFDGFGEQLSPRARRNLEQARRHLLGLLRDGSLAGALAAGTQGGPA